jgi:hypothetical protein
MARKRGGWRTPILWSRFGVDVATNGGDRGQRPQGCKTIGLAGRAAYEVGVGGERQDRLVAWAPDTAQYVDPRR